MEEITLVVWAASIACVILVGIAKAGFAGGIGVVAVPLLCLVMPPSKAVAILLPVLCACDVVSIFFYRRIVSWEKVRELFPGALAGILLAAVFLWLWTGDEAATERGLKILVGFLALLFVFYQGARAWIFQRIERYHPAAWHGALCGLATGFTSAIAHAGGPPVTMYLLPQHMDRRLFVGTTVWLFTFINAAKLLPYYLLGLFSAENLAMSLSLLPAVPFGVCAGVWLNRRLEQGLFVKVVYAILFLTGVQLVTGWDPIGAAAALLGAG